MCGKSSSVPKIAIHKQLLKELINFKPSEPAHTTFLDEGEKVCLGKVIFPQGDW